MTLQEKIRQDLKTSMKAKTEARTSALRVLIGEFQRQLSKELSDQEVVAIIKKLIKSETETMARTKATESDYLNVLQEYLPIQPSVEEVRAWIAANIDMAQFKNKMQAMRPIMTHFGSSVDGDVVRRILEEI